MPSGDIARQWFVAGEGIDRHVIVTDIQRYLGNDATVRPGKGTGENEGVQGYWIKAYRNLTTAMIADLRADSARWRQEQRMPGTRGSQSPRVLNQSGITVPDKVPDYVGSHTYHNSQAARAPRSRDGDSPAVEAPSFGSSVPSRPLQMDRMPDPRDPRMPPRMTQERIPVSREPVMPVDSRMQDRMDIDTPSAPPPDRRYQSVPNGYSDPRYGGPDPRGYSDPRPIYPQQEQSPYGRAPVTSSYSQESIYARSSNNPYPPQPNDGAPPGYVRQGNYFVPISSAEPAGRQDAPLYGHSNNYGQPPPPQRSDGRDLRDPRDGPRDPRDPRDQRDPRDPRYAQDYQDPRYAYPSPAATTASLPPTRERDSVTSPPQTSSYGSVPSYEYGSQRPGPQYPSTGQSGQPNQRSGPQPSSRDPSYGGQRPGPPPSNDSSRDARRKRQQ